MVPTFVGYQQNEVDTIQVFQYHKGTNFTAPHDTLLLTADYSATMVIGDTILVVAQRAFPGFLHHFDVKLVNPFDGRTVLVSDMEVNEHEYNCGGLSGREPGDCTSPLLSYKKDGVLFSRGNAANFGRIIIDK